MPQRLRSLASTAVKGVVSVLMGARKANKLPPWLIKAGHDAAGTVKQTHNLYEVRDHFADIYSVSRHRSGKDLLGTASDAASLKNLARAVDIFVDQMATPYRIGGEAFLATAQQAGKMGGTPSNSPPLLARVDFGSWTEPAP